MAVVLLLVFSLVLIGFSTTLGNSEGHQSSFSNDGDENQIDHPWPSFGRDRMDTGLSPYETSHIEGLSKWSFNTGGYIRRSSPAICEKGIIYQASSAGYLYAIYQNGTEKWNIELDTISWSSPAIAEDGTIYIGSSDGYLYAINPNGTEKWSFGTGDRVRSSPTIGEDGTIYVGSYDSNIYAIHPNGTEKWRFETDGLVHTSPAIGEDGTIYVASYDKHLYALNTDGTEKWSLDLDGNFRSSPAIGEDGTIYLGSLSNRLHAVNPNGTVKWNFETSGSIQSSPAIDEEGTIYFGSDRKYVGSDYSNFYAVDPDGQEKWKFETSGSIHSSPAISDEGTIYVGGGLGDNNLYAISPNGSEEWKFPARSHIRASPAIGEDGTIYIGSRDGYLYAIGDRKEDYRLNIKTETAGGSYGSSEEGIEYTGFGTTDPKPGEHEVSPSTEITVNAIPGENWKFSHWSSDIKEERIEEKEITITMTRNKNLSAHFRILEEDYFGTEKERYEPDENIIIEITNHGSGGQIPMRNDLGLHIRNTETEEVVLDFRGGIVLEEVLTYPHTEYLIWNQTDEDGDQVPEGTYEILSEMLNHTAEFQISGIPPELEISNPRVEPEKPRKEEMIEFTVDVTNTGEEALEDTFDFYIDFPCRVRFNESIDATIEPGETETISVNFPARESGEYNVEVEGFEDATFDFEVRESNFLLDTWWLLVMIGFVISLVILGPWYGEKQRGEK